MGRDFLDSRLMGESFFMLFRPGWKNAKEPGAYSLTLQKIHYPMPPLCFFALTCAALAQGFGTQNKFCAPKPQPGEAEDGAKSWREGSSPTSGCRFRRTPTRVPTAAQCFRETIPQSASPAPGWRVSAANLKGRQNLFCAPEPQPGEAEDGAQTHKGAFGDVRLFLSDRPSSGGSRLRQIARQTALPLTGYGAQICDFSPPDSSINPSPPIKETPQNSNSFLHTPARAGQPKYISFFKYREDSKTCGQDECWRRRAYC